MRIHYVRIAVVVLAAIVAGSRNTHAQDGLVRQLGQSDLPAHVRIQAAERLEKQMTLALVPKVAAIAGSVMTERDALAREYDRLLVITPEEPSTPMIGQQARLIKDARKRLDETRRRLRDYRHLAGVLSGLLRKSIADASPEALDELAKPLAKSLRSARDDTRVEAATTLGFIPAPSSARPLLDALTKPPARAALASADGLRRQIEARPAAAKTIGVAGYRVIERAHGRTMKATLKLHKRYRAIAKKHAKLVGKAVDYLTQQLLRAISGKNVKKRGKPKYAAIEKIEDERDEIAADLAWHEQAVSAMGKLLAAVYRRLEPAERDPVKAKLLNAVANPRAEKAVPALHVAAATKDASFAEPVIAVLEGARDDRVRVVACETLASLNAPASIQALAKWMVVANWSVQVSAMRSLETIGGKAAVTALIDGLGDLDGRARFEANETLHRLTGENFHENPVLWKKWWADARERYRGPPRAKTGRLGKKRAADAKRPDTTFFGIVTRSKRITFILDMSGSMEGAVAGALLSLVRSETEHTKKIDAARKELKRAITSMPTDARFNVILYGTDVRAWRPEMIEASADNKAAAIEWVAAEAADGETNIFDALTRALGKSAKTLNVPDPDGPDTLFLLTDGHANRGEILGANDIAGEFRRMNRYRKLIVHTIALGNDADVGFAKKLAEDSGGRFTHITKDVFDR